MNPLHQFWGEGTYMDCTHIRTRGGKTLCGIKASPHQSTATEYNDSFSHQTFKPKQVVGCAECNELMPWRHNGRRI